MLRLELNAQVAIRLGQIGAGAAELTLGGLALLVHLPGESAKPARPAQRFSGLAQIGQFPLNSVLEAGQVKRFGHQFDGFAAGRLTEGLRILRAGNDNRWYVAKLHSQAVDHFQGPLMATHSNCRTLVPGDRQFDDDQLKLLFERNAVIGTALDAWMLQPNWKRGETMPDTLTMESVADQIDYVCQLAGNTKHAAIGTDLDGGYGIDEVQRIGKTGVVAIIRNGEGPVVAMHGDIDALPMAERALEMMCNRANERQAFGGPLGEKQFVQEAIAASRMEIDQARLLTLKAAWLMDTRGKREARREISMIKVVAANVVMDVLDRAIQIHGSLGASYEMPFGSMVMESFHMGLADGPTEIHKVAVAKSLLRSWNVSCRPKVTDSNTLQTSCGLLPRCWIKMRE